MLVFIFDCLSEWGDIRHFSLQLATEELLHRGVSGLASEVGQRPEFESSCSTQRITCGCRLFYVVNVIIGVTVSDINVASFLGSWRGCAVIWIFLLKRRNGQRVGRNQEGNNGAARCGL